MNQLHDIYKAISGDMEDVSRCLEDIESDNNPLLSALLNQVLANPGKRIRSTIVILSSKFYPADIDRVIKSAAAIELLHMASMVHDDVVDESNLRRGLPTINAEWGSREAVLLGDHLLSKAIKLVCTTENLEMIDRFANLSLDLTIGEFDEMNHTFNLNQNRDQYLKRLRRKTASMFIVAASAGPLLGNAPEEIIEQLGDYGYNLGMAFQIIDDILDFVGTSNRLGKPVGSDLKNGIITLPVIVLMEQYPEFKPVQDMYVKTQSSNHAFNNHVLTPEGYADFPKVNQDALEETISFILEKGIIDQCYSIAKDYSANATSSLKNLEPNKYKDLLELTVNTMINRDV